MKKRLSTWILVLSMCLGTSALAYQPEISDGSENLRMILTATQDDAEKVKASIHDFSVVEENIDEFASLSSIAKTDNSEVAIQPHSTMERVKSYCYHLTAYNKDVTMTAWVYKDVLVPNGKELVCIDDCKIASIEYDAYYNNVKYAMVTRVECVYELR